MLNHRQVHSVQKCNVHASAAHCVIPLQGRINHDQLVTPLKKSPVMQASMIKSWRNKRCNPSTFVPKNFKRTNDMDEQKEKGSWWGTFPGILTGISAVIGALVHTATGTGHNWRSKLDGQCLSGRTECRYRGDLPRYSSWQQLRHTENDKRLPLHL